MSGTKNNRELYKAAFSKLHASEAVIRKEEKMLKAKYGNTLSEAKEIICDNKINSLHFLIENGKL